MREDGGNTNNSGCARKAGGLWLQQQQQRNAHCSVRSAAPDHRSTANNLRTLPHLGLCSGPRVRLQAGSAFGS